MRAMVGRKQAKAGLGSDFEQDWTGCGLVSVDGPEDEGGEGCQEQGCVREDEG